MKSLWKNSLAVVFASMFCLQAADKKAMIAVVDSSQKLKKAQLNSLKAVITAKLSSEKVAVVDWHDRLAGSDTKVMPNDTALTNLSKSLKIPMGIKVDVTDLSESTKTLKPGSQHNLSGKVSIAKLMVSLKVINTEDGASLYGDVVEASDRLSVTSTLKLIDNSRMSRLYKEVADKLATNIADKWAKLNVKELSSNLASFSVKSNIEGVTVKVDGVAVVSDGNVYKAEAGLHKMRIEREWFKTWEGMVNITDGGSIQITMELSEAGLARYRSVELFKLAMKEAEQGLEIAKKEAEAGIEIAKQQSEAEAARKKLEAEGKKSYLQNSKIVIDGKINELNINKDDDDDDDDDDAPINQIINITK